MTWPSLDVLEIVKILLRAFIGGTLDFLVFCAILAWIETARRP